MIKESNILIKIKVNSDAYSKLSDADKIRVVKTKLNSLYGKVVTDMLNGYIVVHRAKKPIIIFTKSILAVEKDDDGTAVIYCSENAVFYVDEKYADVIKQIV